MTPPSAAALEAVPDQDPGSHVDRLPRRLGVWSAGAVLVGLCIGSGIFRVMGGETGIAARAGTAGAISMVWVIGAIVALFGALTIAELAVMFPRSGGIYVFLREGYGRLPAFLFGWTELLVIRPSALGAISMIFGEYASRLFGFGAGGVRWAAGGAIVALALANIRSVKWGAYVQNISTAAKVFAILGLALAGFLVGDGPGAFGEPLSFAPVSWGTFGLAVVSVMWAYDGWADLTFMAGEVKDPDRNLPRAIIGGVLVVVVVYLSIVAAYMYLLTVPEMAASGLVASDAGERIFGRIGGSLVAALVVVSTFGTLNGTTMASPRIFYAMAEDRLFFKAVGAVHPKYKTPYGAILLAATLGVSYVSVRSFGQLADSFVLGIWPFYALAVGAVFALRRKRPDIPRPYRAVGYPVVPLVFLLGAVAMLANSAINNSRDTLIGFTVILLGIPVFFIWQALRKDPA
jgi:basic amino acid/polyamine antiporter, APA family